MTIDMRIPCPPFEGVAAALLEVVSESPGATARGAYIDNHGFPHDLVGHVLSRLDAPIREAASGHMPHHVIAKAAAGVPGTPRSRARFPLLWNRLFTDGNGPDTPYDGRFVMFPRTPHGWEDYLVYALLGHIVDPQGRGRHDELDWKGEAIRGIKSFRRFLNSPTSGFLVQTHGEYEDLRELADRTTLNLLEELNK
jgi:hypothetical protein